MFINFIHTPTGTGHGVQESAVGAFADLLGFDNVRDVLEFILAKSLNPLEFEIEQPLWDRIFEGDASAKGELIQLVTESVRLEDFELQGSVYINPNIDYYRSLSESSTSRSE